MIDIIEPFCESCRQSKQIEYHDDRSVKAVTHFCKNAKQVYSVGFECGEAIIRWDVPVTPSLSPTTPSQKIYPINAGYSLYRRPNQVGGHVYSSDEIDGGVVVWDTSLVNKITLLTAITQEEIRIVDEVIKEQKDKK